jgi:hypothetical protein
MTTKSPGNGTLSGRANECQTCYGTGEIVSDHGPESCHDCYGDGRSANQGLPDVMFLLQELRQAREALVLILTRCQDADDTDEIAAYVRARAHEALRL